MAKKKSNQGGIRSGSGRKPIHGERLVVYGTKLKPEQKEFLQSLDNASAWLIEMIDQSEQFQKSEKQK